MGSELRDVLTDAFQNGATIKKKTLTGKTAFLFRHNLMTHDSNHHHVI